MNADDIEGLLGELGRIADALEGANELRAIDTWLRLDPASTPVTSWEYQKRIRPILTDHLRFLEPHQDANE